MNPDLQSSGLYSPVSTSQLALPSLHFPLTSLHFPLSIFQSPFSNFQFPLSGFESWNQQGKCIGHDFKCCRERPHQFAIEFEANGIAGNLGGAAELTRLHKFHIAEA
jgi:hypothetical protein